MTSKRQRLFLVPLAMAVLQLAGCAVPPPRPQQLARGDYAVVTQHVEALIAHEMRAHGVTGLSIALVDDQQVVWARGAGWADREAGLPATPHTVYRMGSISKLLTTAAALQLAQQGRLALDAPIEQALPEFRIRSRYAAAPITPRLLMTHHAGLPRDVLRGMWGREVGDYRDMVARLAEADLAYAPGSVLSYSNVGMSVLGAAVERAAGGPYAAHLQRALLEPLGMHNASFAAGAPAATRAYDRDKPAEEPALRDLPAGGLNASVLDMSRFLMMLFADGRAGGHSVLEPDMVAQMFRVQNADVALDRDLRIGLGWMLTSFGSDTLHGAGTVAHHNGATIHFRSQMYALPEHKLGVIVASNSDTAGQVVDTIAKRALALALEAGRGVRAQEAAPDFRPALDAWADAALQAWVGDYTTIAGHVRIVREGRRLKARIAGRELQLREGENGSVGLRFALLGLIPISLDGLERVAFQRRDIGGRALLVARVGGQELLAGERMAPHGAAGLDLQRLVGDYEPVFEPGEYRLIDKVQLALDDDVLVARTTLAVADGPPAAMPVRVVSDGEVQVLGALADAGEIARLREAGGEITFEFSGYTFRSRRP